MFYAGIVVGAAAVFGAKSYFGSFRRGEDRKEIEELQLRLSQKIAAGAGVEAGLRAEISNLTDQLNEANSLLAQRVQRAATASSNTQASATAPPPAPPMGKLASKRARDTFLDARQLAQEFTAFLEAPHNKYRAESVKAALRLDVATAVHSLENAMRASLAVHVGKWLKEERRPPQVDPSDWEEAVDASILDARNEALATYKYPNACLLVRDIVTNLRQHFRPKLLEAQGSIVAELQVRLHKRPKKQH